MHALGFVAGAGYLRAEQREKFRAPTEAKEEAWFPGVLTEKRNRHLPCRASHALVRSVTDTQRRELLLPLGVDCDCTNNSVAIFLNLLRF